jgi:4-amino-4-deoxy-L-arabinose transferase-like glycosyltransferase
MNHYINITNKNTNRLADKIPPLLDSKYFVPLCFLAFFLIRWALIIFVPVEPSSDAAWYYGRAKTLALEGEYSEQGILTAFWPIGYPAFLGLLFKVFGPSVLVGKIANLLLACASFAVLYWVALKLFGSIRIARIAVLLISLYPNNAAYASLLLTETLYAFLVLTAILLLLDRASLWRLVVAGIILGLATLVKTQTILLVPFLIAIATWEGLSVTGMLGVSRRTIAVGLIAMAVVSPWTLRNYKVFGEFILVSTNGGISWLSGNNPSVVGDYLHDFSETDPLVKSVNFSVADQVASDKRARALAMDWIKNNIGAFIGLMPKKIFRLWAPDGEAEWGYQMGSPIYAGNEFWFRLCRGANQAFYVFVLALSMMALWRLAVSRAPLRQYVGYGMAAFFTALCMVFSGQSRYHFPLMPLMIVYSAYTINLGISKFWQTEHAHPRLVPNVEGFGDVGSSVALADAPYAEELKTGEKVEETV